MAPPMLVDMSDSYKYLGQKGLAAMLYTPYMVFTSIGEKGRCCTRCDLWDHDMQERKCRREIHSGFETHEEGHTKSKTGATSGPTK